MKNEKTLDRPEEAKPHKVHRALYNAVSLPYQAGYLFLYWIAVVVFFHCLDFRIFDFEVSSVLSKSLLLVDSGRLSYEGQSIYDSLTLGPLAHLLGALPLLVTRDIHYLYYFCSLLLVLSVPLFYLGCREIIRHGIFKVVATFIFLCFMLREEFPVLPDNTHFRPIFMALYFYLLARSNRGERSIQLWLWVSIGLCMNCNISMASFVPATLALKPPRTRADWKLVGWGLAIVIALNAQLLFQLFDSSAVEKGLAAVAGGGTGWKFSGLYFNLLMLWLVAPYLVLGPWMLAPALGALIDWSETEFKTKIRPYVYGLGAQYLFVVALFPVFNLIRKIWFPTFYYYEPSVIFWTVLIAGFLHFSLKPKASRPRKMIGWIAWVLVVGSFILSAQKQMAVAADPKSHADHPDDQIWVVRLIQLDHQIQIARRIQQAVRKMGSANFTIYEHSYDWQDNRYCESYAGTSNSFATLVQYLYPEVGRRFSMADGDWYFHILVQPIPKAYGLRLVPRSSARSVHLDEFVTGRQYFSFFLTPATKQKVDFRGANDPNGLQDIKGCLKRKFR